MHLSFNACTASLFLEKSKCLCAGKALLWKDLLLIKAGKSLLLAIHGVLSQF